MVGADCRHWSTGKTDPWPVLRNLNYLFGQDLASCTTTSLLIRHRSTATDSTQRISLSFRMLSHMTSLFWVLSSSGSGPLHLANEGPAIVSPDAATCLLAQGTVVQGRPRVPRYQGRTSTVTAYACYLDRPLFLGYGCSVLNAATDTALH